MEGICRKFLKGQKLIFWPYPISWQGEKRNFGGVTITIAFRGKTRKTRILKIKGGYRIARDSMTI
jgi:hypothetical protein